MRKFRWLILSLWLVPFLGVIARAQCPPLLQSLDLPEISFAVGVENDFAAIKRIGHQYGQEMGQIYTPNLKQGMESKSLVVAKDSGGEVVALFFGTGIKRGGAPSTSLPSHENTCARNRSSVTQRSSATAKIANGFHKYSVTRILSLFRPDFYGHRTQ